MLKRLLHSSWLHPLLLLFWMLIGTMLRFTQLPSKPLWSDEFATIVFSLGHSFRTIPLNQILTIEDLLEPLKPSSAGSINDVVNHLMTESTHPPLYFILNHWWMQLFSATDAVVSPAIVRSLPALLGVLSIPALFGLGWLIFRSLTISHLAAALMAVSPFGVYLAQEARHYTLAILWGIASIACLVVALRRIQQRDRLPAWVGVIWVIVNSLGMATHYFFGLTLCAEGLVLSSCWLLGARPGKKHHWWGKSPAWAQVYTAAAGTVCGCLVWLPAWQGSHYREATLWAYDYYHGNLDWLNPVRYTLTGIITMLTLFPVRRWDGSVLAVLTGLAFCFSLWVGLLISRNLRTQWQQSEDRRLLKGLIGIVVGAVIILCLIDYVQGSRLTVGLRYSFIYFPAAILLFAVGLAPQWTSANLDMASLPLTSVKPRHHINRLLLQNRLSIVVILLVASISALGVCFNLGYQKVHRPDLVAPDIQALSQAAAVIAIPQHGHSEIRRLMGLAYELRRSPLSPQFYFDQQPCEAETEPACNTVTPAFQQTLLHLPRPFDLWLIDFAGIPDLKAQKCLFDSNLETKRPAGFNYQHYRCPT